jgi:small multidrug resistance pump
VQAIYYVALLAAIVLGVFGQLLFKSGAMRSGDSIRQFIDPLTVAGFAIYACSAALYVVSLRKLPLSIAFPSVSLSYVAVAIAGHVLWHEPLGWPQLAGMLLIVVGVVLLSSGL